MNPDAWTALSRFNHTLERARQLDVDQNRIWIQFLNTIIAPVRIKRLVTASWFASWSFLRWSFWSHRLITLATTSTPTKILFLLFLRRYSFAFFAVCFLLLFLSSLLFALFRFLFRWAEVHIWNIHVVYDLFLE